MQSPTPSTCLNDSSHTLYKRMRREEKKGDSSRQQVGGESVNSVLCCGCYKPAAIHTEFERAWAEFSEMQSLSR